jgi:hypothetical protein
VALSMLSIFCLLDQVMVAPKCLSFMYGIILLGGVLWKQGLSAEVEDSDLYKDLVYICNPVCTLVAGSSASRQHEHLFCVHCHQVQTPSSYSCLDARFVGYD